MLDADDKCPNKPETINGVDDDDGCPDGPRSPVRWDGDRVAIEGLGRFPAGSAKLSPALEKQVRMMAILTRSRTPLAEVVVEAWPDRRGDTSVRALELASARGRAIKQVFVAAGIPDAVVLATPGDPNAKGASAIEVSARRKARVRLRPRPPASDSPPRP